MENKRDDLQECVEQPERCLELSVWENQGTKAKQKVLIRGSES
ncbi:MAG: hypothetical protein AB9917_18545 [Negativicutes bacterium]